MTESVNLYLTAFNAEFCFKVFRKKDVQLGPTRVDQYWMKPTALYSQQRSGYPQRTHNHKELLRHFWHTSQLDESADLRVTQERFLHAFLVPYVRSQGSRRVFADACLNMGQGLRKKQAAQLSQFLEASRAAGYAGKEESVETFQEKSKKLLGPGEFPEEALTIRNQLTHELFDDACEALDHGDVKRAGLLALDRWFELEHRIGRRAHRDMEKLALDMLSYEARAAMHDVHSAAWCSILQVQYLKQRILRPLVVVSAVLAHGLRSA